MRFGWALQRGIAFVFEVAMLRARVNSNKIWMSIACWSRFGLVEDGGRQLDANTSRQEQRPINPMMVLDWGWTMKRNKVA